jgi:hypothetical protein
MSTEAAGAAVADQPGVSAIAAASRRTRGSAVRAIATSTAVADEQAAGTAVAATRA